VVSQVAEDVVTRYGPKLALVQQRVQELQVRRRGGLWARGWAATCWCCAAQLCSSAVCSSAACVSAVPVRSCVLC
jgi:hypothetical protein